MRKRLKLLKLQIKSAFLSIPKIILGTIVTAVLVIAISACVGIVASQDSDMKMRLLLCIRIIMGRIIRNLNILRWHLIMSVR